MFTTARTKSSLNVCKNDNTANERKALSQFLLVVKRPTAKQIPSRTRTMYRYKLSVSSSATNYLRRRPVIPGQPTLNPSPSSVQDKLYSPRHNNTWLLGWSSRSLGRSAPDREREAMKGDHNGWSLGRKTRSIVATV